MSEFSELFKLDRERERELDWTGTFLEYLDVVLERPKVAQLAHARIFDMIMDAGYEDRADGQREYHFFANELFGMEEPLHQLVEYFHGSAKRSEVRKRILLLMGPVGGGKSTLAAKIKRGLELYTTTPEGALYAIADCPMHEEPLHLLPRHLRDEVGERLAVTVEGDLCPRCRWSLKAEYDGDYGRVPVRRIRLSERGRRGIGTFLPSDPKSQDQAELVGSVDLSKLGEFGESDPRAFSLDGELEVANRGIVEMVEMLKADEKFLYVLLTLAQEQLIKAPRLPLIYADEVIVSHTNETEYEKFSQDRRSEALQDRVILVRVPYNLRVDDEIKIYEKLIAQSDLKHVHLAPHTLRIASMFAVLTRLEPSEKLPDPLQKMKLYNGEEVVGKKSQDAVELRKESKREGMDGLGPRFVINALSAALINDPDNNTIDPIDAIRALRSRLPRHVGLGKDDIERYDEFLLAVREEYDQIAQNEVNKAFVYAFEEQADSLFRNYIRNADAYTSKEKVLDPVTDEERDPDEKLMRAIEEQIGISENAKRTFRQEVLVFAGRMTLKGRTFDYRSYEPLKEATEKKLFTDLKDVVRVTAGARSPDPEQLKRISEVSRRLIEEQGYNEVSATKLLDYVGNLLNR